MKRPYITIPHIVAEILSYVLLFASFIIIIRMAQILPDKIPTHYDLRGNVDGYGSPMSLIILPLIMLFSNAAFSLVLHLVDASCWNMPFKVKPANSLQVYKDVSWMFVFMMDEFSLFSLLSVFFALRQNGSIIGILCILLLVFMGASIIVTLMTAAKHNR